MNDWAGILTAAGGFLTVLFAGLRWLIRVYMVKVKEAELARKAAFTSELEKVKAEATALKEKIKEHSTKLDEVDRRIGVLMTLHEQTIHGFSGISNSLRDFIKENNEQHKQHRERVDKLDKLVVGLGKVIVKNGKS